MSGYNKHTPHLTPSATTRLGGVPSQLYPFHKMEDAMTVLLRSSISTATTRGLKEDLKANGSERPVHAGLSMTMVRQHTDILPQHTSDEIEALRDDLRVNGLKVPVILDEADSIIDGRLRARLCDTLGIDWRQTAKVESGLTDDQKAALRIRLNLLRRSTPPTAAQRREYVRTLLKAEPELSNGTIAHLCGMDPSSISRIRSGMEVKGEVKAAEVTTGRDGRVRPKAQRSERPTTVAKSARQQSTQAQPQPSQREDNAPVVRPQVTDLPAVQPKVEQPVAANQPEVRNPQESANHASPETDEGVLDCSSLKLKLVRAVSADHDCWEWVAKDEHGCDYIISCRRVETTATAIRKVA